MRDMQSHDMPRSAESFRPSGNKEKDAKDALSQSALHAEVARNQTGEARENSLKEADAWRSAFNQISGNNYSPSDVDRVARLAVDGKNNGYENGLSDVVKTRSARRALRPAEYRLALLIMSWVEVCATATAEVRIC